MKITIFEMKDTLDRIIIRLNTMEVKIMEPEETSVVKTSLKVQKQRPSLVLNPSSKYQ